MKSYKNSEVGAGDRTTTKLLTNGDQTFSEILQAI